MIRLLVVEEDQSLRDFLQNALPPGFQLHYWPNGDDLSGRLKLHKYDAFILSLELNGEDGFALLRSFKSSFPDIPVIAISGIENVERIVKAIKEGAFDFLSKPFSREKMHLVIERALEDRRLRNELDYLRRQQDVVYDLDQIIAASSSMKQVIDTIRKFSVTDGTVLITGETGTGKSFLSGAIHFNSRRRGKPFIKINCANIQETLLESELFGHERGAFTGANRMRTGRLEQANGGTVFLDEIGEMSLALQAKFLRVLEDKSFERLGGSLTIRSDIRIIAATNRVLEKEVAARKFREDLYYRINVLRVDIPPLRHRRECIESLAHHLLSKSCRSLKVPEKRIERDAIDRLTQYHWPGNIRQLANILERAVTLSESPVIRRECIQLQDLPESTGKQRDAHPAQPLEAMTREAILNALEESGWVQKKAAESLGVSPRCLNYRIKRLGITHVRWLKHR